MTASPPRDPRRACRVVGEGPTLIHRAYRAREELGVRVHPDSGAEEEPTIVPANSPDKEP